MIFDETSLLFNPREQFLTFRTKREGILVEDASLKFRFLGGRLVQVVANTYPSLNLEYEDPDVDSKAVLENLGFERVNKRDKVLRIAKEGPRKVLRPVDRLTAFKNGQYFEVQVSLRDGRVYEVAPTTFHLAGKVEADIYSRWYGEESLKLPLADLTLAQNLATNKEGMFEVEPKTEVKLNGLNGKNVNIHLVSGDQISVAGVTNQNFMSVLVPRLVGDAFADKQAAQSMVYFHTDLINKTARQFIDNDWLRKTLKANLNLRSTCNAHWDGTTINFYSSDSECANTGLIADVVYHEWGHGLDHSFGGITDGAYSEGFGDIMSLVFTKSPKLGIGFLLDGHKPVRDLEEDALYPGPDSGQGVHKEGLSLDQPFGIYL